VALIGAPAPFPADHASPRERPELVLDMAPNFWVTGVEHRDERRISVLPLAGGLAAPFGDVGGKAPVEEDFEDRDMDIGQRSKLLPYCRQAYCSLLFHGVMEVSG